MATKELGILEKEEKRLKTTPCMMSRLSKTIEPEKLPNILVVDFANKALALVTQENLGLGSSIVLCYFTGRRDIF